MELDEISRKLAEPPEDMEKVRELGMDFMEKEKELQEAMEEWESLHL